jgi:hypothetical protein
MWVPHRANCEPYLIHSQNGNHPKINPETVAYFSGPKNHHQRTIVHHESTTNSPSKNHVQSPIFPKTPAKTPKAPRQKKFHKSPSNSPMFPGAIIVLDGTSVVWEADVRANATELTVASDTVAKILG